MYASKVHTGIPMLGWKDCLLSVGFRKAIGRQNSPAHQIPSWPKYRESFELIRALEIFDLKIKNKKPNMATWGKVHLPKKPPQKTAAKNHLPAR